MCDKVSFEEYVDKGKVISVTDYEKTYGKHMYNLVSETNRVKEIYINTDPNKPYYCDTSKAYYYDKEIDMLVWCLHYVGD